MKTIKKLILTGMILAGIQMMAQGYYNIKNSRVYWINKELKEVDSKTVTIITSDGKNIPVYNGRGQIDAPLIKDKNNVYYQGTKIQGADPNTFDVLENGYFKDKNSVYFYGNKIKGVDPNTFEILEYDYFKDKNNVYYKREQIKGADPNTFETDKNNGEAKDKNHKYRFGKVKK